MDKKLEEQAKGLHQIVGELVKKYQFRDRNEICCYGVSVSQCYALEAIEEQGQMTMGGLAGQLHLTVSTMTRVVDQLVEKELVTRWFNPQDRRVCCVELTPAGRALLDKIQGEVLATEKEILKKINPRDRETLLWALRELSNAVDQWREKQVETDQKLVTIQKNKRRKQS